MRHITQVLAISFVLVAGSAYAQTAATPQSTPATPSVQADAAGQTNPNKAAKKAARKARKAAKAQKKAARAQRKAAKAAAQ
jgi:hypothetical protein